MTGWHLRPAQPTDAGRTGEILSAFIDETPWMPRIHTRAEDLSFAGTMISRGWVTVAERDNAVAGFVARDAHELHALYVATDQRQAGCGSALLDRMKQDRQRLELWTFQANAGARRFYLRHGFEEVARTDGRDNDEHLPDIRFVWRQG